MGQPQASLGSSDDNKTDLDFYQTPKISLYNSSAKLNIPKDDDLTLGLGIDTNEFDRLLDQVATEYHNPNSINDNNDNKINDNQSTVTVSVKPVILPKIAAKTFVPSQNIVDNIKTIFKYIKQLGTGASCRVLKVRHNQNKKLYAVKQLNKNHPINLTLFHCEVNLLKKLNHCNILKYYDCYMDKQCYYIATEYCEGGTMLKKILSMSHFSENIASNYIKVILSAIDYMHNLNIVHRDIKPQNMIFNLEGKLQIIDFGDSIIVKDDNKYNQFVGTIYYMAPEITRARTGKELKKGDLWSIGIVTYLLVCGRVPFDGKTQKETLAKILSFKCNQLKYPKKIKLTDSCKDFVNKLLNDNVKERWDAKQALAHEWISGSGASTTHLSGNVLKDLKQYEYHNKLQDILVNAILTEIDDKDIKLVSQFDNLNVNPDPDEIVDILLLNSSIGEIPEKRKYAKERVNKIIQYQSKKKIDIPSVDQNDNNNINDNIVDYSDNDDNKDYLDQLDITSMLKDLTDTQTSILYGKPNINSMDNKTNNDDDNIPSTGNLSAPSTHLHPRTSSDFSGHRISVNKFRAIMGKSVKHYDVGTLVNDLNDGTGYIPIDNIASYTKKVDTLSDVFANSVDANSVDANSVGLKNTKD